MKTKFCTKCNKEYPVTMKYFPPDERYKNGFSSWCRKCHNDVTIIWSKKNPEKIKGNLKKYHKTLKGRVTRLMSSIKQRCTKSGAQNYKRYGGRGIKCYFTHVELYNWIVAKGIDPRGLDIHRIDNDGNYALNNIEFLTGTEHKQQHVKLRSKFNERCNI